MKYLQVLLLFSVLILASCTSEQKSDSSKADATVSDATSASSSVFEMIDNDVALDGTPATIAGLQFTPPSGWTDNGPSGMRQADYSFGPVEGDSEAASMTVFYFGPQQGGNVQDNLNRWVGQMATPGAIESQGKATKNELMIEGMKVSTVEVVGSYSGSMGGPMSGQTDAKDNYRLVGAVVEGPQGNVFFKLTGPDKTAVAMTSGFVAMIQAIQKADESK